MSLAACPHIVGVHNCVPTHSRLTVHEFHAAVRSHVIIMLAFTHTSVTCSVSAHGRCFLGNLVKQRQVAANLGETEGLGSG